MKVCFSLYTFFKLHAPCNVFILLFLHTSILFLSFSRPIFYIYPLHSSFSTLFLCSLWFFSTPSFLAFFLLILLPISFLLFFTISAQFIVCIQTEKTEKIYRFHFVSFSGVLSGRLKRCAGLLNYVMAALRGDLIRKKIDR